MIWGQSVRGKRGVGFERYPKGRMSRICKLIRYKGWGESEGEGRNGQSQDVQPCPLRDPKLETTSQSPLYNEPHSSWNFANIHKCLLSE